MLLPGLAASSVAGELASTRCAAPASGRHHVRFVDLNHDGVSERVDVYNSEAAPTPVTMLMVCRRVRGAFVIVQRRVLDESPGAPDSGLVGAWVADLNRDGRVEVAARDFLTPSAGEVLTILRQAGAQARTFRILQRIDGDRVVMVPLERRAAIVRVDIKANHAADGRAHVETWRWTASASRWLCRADCGGRPGAASTGVAAASPSIYVRPAEVHAGQTTRVYGWAAGCAAGDKVTLISRAFVHAHDFAGLPAIYAPVSSGGAYSVRTRIPVHRRAGRYAISARCGGGNLGVRAVLTVLRH